MKAFSKIGFHTSVGGNPSGIGDHLKRLDAAGVPFFIKSADGMTGVFDAQEIMRDSDVPHTAVFRRSVRYAGAAPIENPDVPDYNLSPEAAAQKHWQWHKAGLPPELDRNLVWIETINEVRKEVEWGDWLGNFAYHTAQIMMAEGYKFSAFGFSSGTPEPGAWETDGMLRYLELCQQHPDKASVALHEYSFKTEDIWFMRGDLIGRFEKLFAACDRHKIKRPKILITEWGWTFDRVPDAATAMRHIKEVAAYYARYPEILGAAIWYLGPGFGGIANKTQKLIKPVTDYAVSATFDVPDPADEDGTEPTFPMPPEQPPDAPDEEAPTLQPNGRFIRDVTIPDDTHLTTGAAFTKTWRVENNGQATWGDGYKFVHTDGLAMTDVTERPLPAAAPGQQIEIPINFTVPDTPGAHFSDWRFQAPDGSQFGDIIYTRIIADAPPAAPGGVSDCRFVTDVTVPDDTEMAAGKRFTKTWRVRNAGTRAWGAGFTLEFVGGEKMGARDSYSVPATQPGAETEISVDLRAPTASGTHYVDFRMKDDRGHVFGEILYARIVVPWQAGASLTQPQSQRDPLWAETRLGHAGSPKTIGEWGCLLACFAMTANALGKNTTPLQLNRAMVNKGGFMNLYLTKWNALGSVYADIVYGGKVHGPSTPDLIARIDANLAQGRPVSVQVDFTSDTPYTDNDQHWALIVRKDGDDYRINDPWLLPGQEASLRERYGRAGRPLKDAIMSAIFYRSTAVTHPPAPVIDRAPGFEVIELQTGMNVNPDAPHSNPFDNDDLKGLDWVRFVFKIDARVNEAERGNINKAFAQYDPIVRAYNKMGVKTLFVINQETIWSKAPWAGSNDWRGYASDLASAARKIARRYRRYGDKVGYEIWNEGDKPGNPASVFVPPEQFAIILKDVAAAIRAESSHSPLVFGGLATGPEEGIAYLQRCKAALNGPWPVDAIGIHPYTRWATRAPFDWGQQYGTLGQAFDKYRAAIPDIPFWITELGVADDNEIGSQHYAAIGDYMKDVYSHVADRHTDLVPVLIWFAWTDWMRNAGVLDRDGKRKPHVYPAFRAVRNRELNA